MLRSFFRARAIGGFVLGFFAVLAGGLSWSAFGWTTEPKLLHLSCVNRVGGAHLSIVVDLDDRLVDSLPATTFNDKWISWHDPSRGYLDLERATGKLDIRNASSTGGYFLHYLCQPE
jgi:hypothetical protein